MPKGRSPKMKKACFALMLLALACLLPAQNFPLTLTAPNGGEIWNTGSTYLITWSQVNLAGPASLMLLSGTDPASTTIMIAPSVPVVAGQFNWTIPPNIPTGANYKVRINLATANGMMIWDASDGPFTIQGGTNPPPPQMSITVVAPNGGEQWAAGSTQTIAWNFTNLTGEVSIGLIGANTNAQIIIAPSVPIDAQNFQWTVPANFAPGLYKVHIVWLSVLDIYFGDQSDGWFMVVNGTPPPPQPIVLTSPNGGEVWTVGATYPITWTSSQLAGVVNLTLAGTNDPNGLTIPIAAGIPVAGQSFAWTIPNAIPPGANYRVRIALVSPDGVLIQDFSDGVFTLQAGENPPPQAITVTSPNGGETWAKGTTHDITWTDASNASAVRIFLLWEGPNGTRRLIIARNAPNTGSYSWFIPVRLPVGTHYRVAVKNISGAMDLSDGQFSISGPALTISARPNPTRVGTTLSFEFTAPSDASIRVYNVRGQIVRTLVDSQILSGRQTISWDGNDQNGRKVSAGIYFARIEAPGFNASRKLVVLK